MASSKVMRHNRRVLASLREGDLIEFSRGAYSHWAIYIGKEDVIHMTGNDNDRVSQQVNPTHLTSFSGQIFNKATIRIDNFFSIAGTNKAKRNNSLDRKKQPFSRRQIVQNALSRLGEVGYNVLKKNCQHFATWCRYGQASSAQVENLVTTAGVGVAAVVAGACIAATVINKKSKKQSRWLA